MHARSLHDFFLRQPTRKGDVAVRQLLPCELADWKPDGLDALAESIRAINKHRSHLTYDRLDDEATWRVTAIRVEIDSAFEQLVAVLPESERAFWQA